MLNKVKGNKLPPKALFSLFALSLNKTGFAPTERSLYTDILLVSLAHQRNDLWIGLA